MQHEQIDSPLVSTSHSNNGHLIGDVDALIISAMEPYLAEHLNGYNIIFSTLVIKKKGENTYTPPHQDASFVNELEDMAFNLWIPLVDTTAHNGCLRFLPGSHSLPLNPRPAPIHPWAYQSVGEIIVKNMSDVSLKAGEPVAFHGACIHASHPNLSAKERPSVVMAITNSDARWIQYYCSDYQSNTIEEYPMKKENYVHYVKGSIPSPEPPISRFVMKAPSMKAFYLKYQPWQLLKEFINGKSLKPVAQ